MAVNRKPTTVAASGLTKDEDVKEYVCLLTPVRETFLDDATDEENRIVEEHFRYLEDLLAKGRLILAGRCLDGPPGIVVFEAESADAAEGIMNNDPAVKAGIFRAEVHPYRVALLRSG
ncbi:MAG: hypothetical protein KJ749_13750 [Planctomycetes bacterium]|nr:hypothetical protein [Planctomycetota bacterium]